MEIDKILSIKQTGGFNINSQPEWEVTFEADGKPFKIEQVIQWTKPTLWTIQSLAETHTNWFWQSAAKAVVCL